MNYMTGSLDYLDSVSDCKNYGHLIDLFELKHLKKREGKKLSQLIFLELVSPWFIM